MPKLEITPALRTYSFTVNGYTFRFSMEWKAEDGISAKDVLLRDLEECVAQLRAMPEFSVKEPFTLPPVNPNDTSSANT